MYINYIVLCIREQRGLFRTTTVCHRNVANLCALTVSDALGSAAGGGSYYDCTHYMPRSGLELRISDFGYTYNNITVSGLSTNVVCFGDRSHSSHTIDPPVNNVCP